MPTVEVLEQALDLANRLGYEIRQEWLGGNGGGGCELMGRKLLFIDLALGPAEQLDQAVDTLRRDPRVANLPMPRQLRQSLAMRKSA